MDILFKSRAQRSVFFRMLLSLSCLVLLANLLAACTNGSPLRSPALALQEPYVG